ncbi:unnamed protein product [Prorocentrum cordatum]|uniref:PAS domain-containing protein n=1 Tax=Prorocentrum cordatum TaxID=2364126 RepID=A0ABN9TB35_9DINO|nr:unnamed protein product [Polarella glacialis]
MVTLNMFPRLMTPSRLHFWYSLICISNTLTVSPLLQVADSIDDLKVHIVIDCISFSFVDLTLPLNLFWSTVCYLSAALTLYVGNSNERACDDSGSCNDAFGVAVGGTLAIALFHVVISYVALARLEGQTYWNELRAARSILAGMCDAVVQLDGELRFTQPSHRLATLLLHDPPRALVGERVSNFLATQADREKFVEEVTSITANEEFCKAFHVHMRCNGGSALPLEAFCVRFSSGDEKWSYLVGFR